MDVHGAYKPVYEEIKRRQAVASAEVQNPTSFERAADADGVAFRNDAQRFFVWSASHVAMPPLARDPKQPAVRIYGLFPSSEEAVEHARVVHGVDPTCSVMVSPTHEWVVLPARPERLDDAAPHIDAVLAAYRAKRDASRVAFEENVREHRTGIGPAEEAAKEEEKEEAGKEAEKEEEKAAPQRLGRDAEVRDQSLVAVSFVRDYEPIFMVYAAFEATASGDAWARCAGDHVVDFDIDLCSTCAWLFPNAIESEKVGKEVFRSTELTSIMNNQRTQPQKVENFRKWREDAT